MRQQYTINKLNPQLLVHTTWAVGTIMVSNPTASPIGIALGRTDSPTIDNADFVLPAGILVQIPVVGTDFALAFTNPIALPAIGNTAQISIYSHDEPIGSVGSFGIVVGTQQAPTTMDILLSTVPINPPPSTIRLWSAADEKLFYLDAAGINREIWTDVTQKFWLDLVANLSVVPSPAFGYTRLWSNWNLGEKLFRRSGNTGLDIQIADYLDFAWQTYTPLITQGVSLTIVPTIANYVQIDKIVFGYVNVNITSAGTPTAIITVTLPVAPHAAVSPYIALGQAIYLNSGSNFYQMIGGVVSAPAKQMAFFTGLGPPNFFGANPVITAKNGDSIGYSFMYRAA